MPTYEYECDKCGGQFEIFQSIKDAPKEVCDSCGGHLTKLLSAGTGLIFKGSGFYITDYKTKTGGEGSGDSGGSGSKESKGSASDSGAGSVKSSDGGAGATAGGSSSSGSTKSGADKPASSSDK